MTGCRATLLPAPKGLGHCGRAEQSGCLHTSPSQLLLHSGVRPRPGWLALPPLSRDFSSSRHCWLAVPGACWTEEEPSRWRQDPEDYLPPTWPRGSAGEREPLLAKIYSAPAVGTSPPCQRTPGVPLLSGRDFRAICQSNSSCV